MVSRRPIIRNLSLAGQVKVKLIADLLSATSHEIEIISQGEVIELQLKYYPPFREPDSLTRKVRVFYASALPVRFVNGFWSGLSLLRIFKARNEISPFNLVILYNLKPPQVMCGHYAIRRLGLPVILEYEDGAFVDRTGKRDRRVLSGIHRYAARNLLRSISGCFAVSPSLLAQAPSRVPKVLLRGVIGSEITTANGRGNNCRHNRVVFSGTHYRTGGLQQLIAAWQQLRLPNWELHIAGSGNLTSTLQKQAEGNSSIVFHGCLTREENAHLLCSAKIGINPHDISLVPGNVFPLKIIEYLAAGAHTITTPAGLVEPELEAGMTYMMDNSVETIATTIASVIQDRQYENTVAPAVQEKYGLPAVSRSLETLIREVIRSERLK